MQKSLKDKIALNSSKQGDDEGEDELQMNDKKRCEYRKNVITKLDSFLMDPRISNKVAKKITQDLVETIDAEFESTNKKFGSAGGGDGKIKWYGVPHTERRSSKRYKGCYG